MDIIEGELQRSDQYRDQLTKRKKDHDVPESGNIHSEFEKNYKNYQAILTKQDQVITLCISFSFCLHLKNILGSSSLYLSPIEYC